MFKKLLYEMSLSGLSHTPISAAMKSKSRKNFLIKILAEFLLWALVSLSRYFSLYFQAFFRDCDLSHLALESWYKASEIDLAHDLDSHLDPLFVLIFLAG